VMLSEKLTTMISGVMTFRNRFKRSTLTILSRPPIGLVAAVRNPK
jgi:hypothetical protein